MINGVCVGEGKRPKMKKEDREYTDVSKLSELGDYLKRYKSVCARLDDGFVKVDIDDYDKDENPIGFIRGRPRSEVIYDMLNYLKIKFNCMATDRGAHFYFVKSEQHPVERKRDGWYAPINIKAEWQPGGLQSDVHVPLKVNNKVRNWKKGNALNIDIDPLPAWLTPLQKSSDKPFPLDFPPGNRTQHLGGYVLHLAGKGYTADEAFEIVRLMNFNVFDNPIPKEELEAQTLNEATYQKAQAGQAAKGASDHVAIADEIIARYRLIRANGKYYSYENGVYVKFDESKITSYMSHHYPAATIRVKREVEDHMKGKARVDCPENDGRVNLLNGILVFGENGVTLEPHSPGYISFRQFNAAYDPKALYWTKPL